MKAEDFNRFYRAVHGVVPFPWQSKLAARLCDGAWPQAVDVPTGCGKTTIIDAAVFCMACREPGEAPRRIFYVVDRRLVVDDILGHAQRLAAALADALENKSADAVLRTVANRLSKLSRSGQPLAACAMRGGARLEVEWACEPDLPSVIVSTVDQTGSRLLFRGYSVSEFARSIPAGLAGCDAAIILDEAHISRPFGETLAHVSHLWQEAEHPVGCPPIFIEMTATPTADASDVVRLDAADRKCPPLAVRITRPKFAELRQVAAPDLVNKVLAAAHDLLTAPGNDTVGVVVNRVQTARDIFERLRRGGRAKAHLLTGRIRPFDRQRVLAEALDCCHATRSRDGGPGAKSVIVATQTIEVGADLDFDAMVSESAPIPSLQQRFGRLNRLGLKAEARAVVLHAVSEAAADKADPIYGRDLEAHWKWLWRVAKKTKAGRVVDFGTEAFSRLAARAMRELTLAVPRAPMLLPAHAVLLAHTSPNPTPDVDVAQFLHGVETNPPEIEVCWRADLVQDRAADWAELVNQLPPQAGELMPMPFGAFRRWMAGGRVALADLEGVAERAGRSQSSTSVVVWDGLHAFVTTADTVRPGQCVVLPAAFGGCDEFGFNPAHRPVADVAEACLADALAARRRAGIFRCRLDPAVAGASPERVRALLAELAAEEQPLWPDVAALIRTAFANQPGDCLQQLLQDLPSGRISFKLKPYPQRQPAAVLVEFRCKVSATPRFVEDTEPAEIAPPAREIDLPSHSERVRCRCAEYAERCGLPAPLRDAVALAAAYHDLGKSDPRFQLNLRRGDVARNELDLARNHFLAKPLPGAGWLPLGGYRHEALSVSLLDAEPRLVGGGGLDADLVRWLVGVSHGRGRPFFPPGGDPGNGQASYTLNGLAITAPLRHGLDRLGSGWVELFHRLNARYGLWGLAYLEALVRLSDHQVSAEEAE